jgi:hypothetical protein
MTKQDPRDKFVALAERRVSNALKDIKLIGNLSNKSNYKYDDRDVKKITSTLTKALSDMKAKFESNGASEDELFRLD